MKAIGTFLAVLGVATLSFGCALTRTGADTTAQLSTATIAGVALYRERIALPPGAVFEATLSDVARADAPAVELGRVEIRDPRSPVRFAIPYDTTQIVPQGIYTVRASIRVDGQLWFTSDRFHRVLTGGADDALEIPMKSARRPAPTEPAGTDRESAPIPAHGLRLPATFRGDLPCADCEGVRHHLDLWPDQVFHLRREWLGRGLVHADVGRWRLDPERRALVLQGGTEMPLQFEILGNGHLRQLDLQGNPIVSDLPYELDSDGGLEPADVSLLLGGEMTYVADSARLQECLTGRSYAIAAGPEAARLQSAYLDAVSVPGAALYVTVEGTLTRRAGMEGDDLLPTVTVERFINVWPRQACSRARADASLINTYWRIDRLYGEAVEATPNRREPHVVLRHTDEGLSYATTVGCNQLFGPAETTADGITFRRAATTLMACPAPLADLERRLDELLQHTWQWQIRGSTLELKDLDGNPVALFEAVYF
jgi:uncharacterized lipoprotein YbaY/heat shock protein HslJ